MEDDKKSKKKASTHFLKKLNTLDKKSELKLKKARRALECDPPTDKPKDMKESDIRCTLNGTNSALYHRLVTSSVMDDLIQKLIHMASRGNTWAMQQILSRSLKPEPTFTSHKFIGLSGINNMEKISNAYQLLFDGAADGKLSYKDVNELSKSLTSFSNHLRDTQQLNSMSKNLEMLAESLKKICKDANLQEPKEVSEILDSLNMGKNQ